jgi:hypothetical protein
MNIWDNRGLKSRLDFACVLSFAAAGICVVFAVSSSGVQGFATALLFFVSGCLCEALSRIIQMLEHAAERLHRMENRL